MNWISVKSGKDLDLLNETFGNFHDGLLKEMCFSSGGYVQKDLSMHAFSSPVARFLFQRQWENPSVIEIEFRDIIQINIKPEGIDEFIDIVVARIYLKDTIFFWSARDYELHEVGKDNHTWIAAKFLQWRVRDELLGQGLIYMNE